MSACANSCKLELSLPSPCLRTATFLWTGPTGEHPPSPSGTDSDAAHRARAPLHIMYSLFFGGARPRGHGARDARARRGTRYQT